MEYLFNMQIPDSSKEELIFRPIGKTFITGIAQEYKFYYDYNFLNSHISEKQFNNLFISLNDDLITYWPCWICFYGAYFACPCTCGLAFFCPNSCITVAKENFMNKLNHYNKEYFNPKGLQVTYKQKCSTSWLSVTKIDIVLEDKSTIAEIDITTPLLKKENSIN